jgi:hypothetical protein
VKLNCATDLQFLVLADCLSSSYGKERKEEPEDNDDGGNDYIQKEDGHFEGLALGDEVTSNEDEAAEEEAGDDRILQVAPKSFPVSLVGNRRPITLAL